MVFLHQDMRSPRFAFKTENGQLDIVKMLTKHAFPLSHNLVSVTECVVFYMFFPPSHNRAMTAPCFLKNDH